MRLKKTIIVMRIYLNKYKFINGDYLSIGFAIKTVLISTNIPFFKQIFFNRFSFGIVKCSLKNYQFS